MMIICQGSLAPCFLGGKLFDSLKNPQTHSNPLLTTQLTHTLDFHSLYLVTITAMWNFIIRCEWFG